MSRTRHPCAGLTRRQREVFEQIAVNQCDGHHPKTIATLRAEGLIVRVADRVLGEDRFGAIMVPNYAVPLPIHARWCAWCAENVKEPT